MCGRAHAMGLASPGGSELAELLPGPAISCTEAVLLLPLPPQPPLLEVGWLLSLRSGFVSVIISIVICPLSDPLPGRARKHPSVSVFNGAPSSSSLEKKKQNKRIMNQMFPFSLRPLFPPLIFHTGQFLPLPSCLFGMWPGLSIPGSLAGSCRSQREFSGGRG